MAEQPYQWVRFILDNEFFGVELPVRPGAPLVSDNGDRRLFVVDEMECAMKILMEAGAEEHVRMCLAVNPNLAYVDSEQVEVVPWAEWPRLHEKYNCPFMPALPAFLTKEVEEANEE